MPPRILVVDDDEAYLAGLGELLELHGYEPILASTFEGGQRALREERPVLLLADVRLGPFNGLQLLATSPVRIPAIVVSGFEDSVLQTEARALGAHYLVKPVDTAALLALIDERLATANKSAVVSATPPLGAEEM
jgi:DNA-binding response OmpR family regulator